MTAPTMTVVVKGTSKINSTIPAIGTVKRGDIITAVLTEAEYYKIVAVLDAMVARGVISYTATASGGAYMTKDSPALPRVDASATPGAATINQPSGRVAIAIGASQVVVTNSLVTTTSIVLAVLQTQDTTLTSILRVIPAAGSFTIVGNANATAAVKVGFLVLN